MKIYKLGGEGSIVHYQENGKTIKVRLSLGETAELEANPTGYFNAKKTKAVDPKEESTTVDNGGEPGTQKKAPEVKKATGKNR